MAPQSVMRGQEAPKLMLLQGQIHWAFGQIQSNIFEIRAPPKSPQTALTPIICRNYLLLPKFIVGRFVFIRIERQLLRYKSFDTVIIVTLER